MEGVGSHHENINDIENAMVRIGDMVACEVRRQKSARHKRHAQKIYRLLTVGTWRHTTGLELAS